MVGTNKGKPCVWYKITVEEEIREKRETTDADGNRRTEYHNVWKKMVEDERFHDFYLQDGTVGIVLFLFISPFPHPLIRVMVRASFC